MFLFKIKSFCVLVVLVVATMLTGCGQNVSFSGRDVQSVSVVSNSVGDYSWHEWDESVAPNYYCVYGEAVIEHDNIGDGEYKYGDLDSLGRATYAVGKITVQSFSDELGEEREQNLPNPVGYKGNNKQTVFELYNGDTTKTYFYNRSHLIADSLGGQPILENLVTGTRMQNVGTNNKASSGYGGMAYSEDKVRSYLSTALKENRNVSVYYATRPVYNGDELLPRSVYVDVKSDDNVINEHIEVFNAAKNYTINYTDGSWTKN